MKIWIEKNKKWDGREIFYVMTEGECLASKATLAEAEKVFETAKLNYHKPIQEIVREIEL